MPKMRLDQALVVKDIVTTRSQAENYIRLGYVEVNGQPAVKSGQMVDEKTEIVLTIAETYVSRAALKLASVGISFGLDFKNKTVLDVGSSTGGFTDFALKHGAKKVIAVDVGSGQMHPSLRNNPSVELMEKTDIRNLSSLSSKPDIVLIDVSFISIREVLPTVIKLADDETNIIAMVKPQFESIRQNLNKGIVKNEKLRRQILKDFEAWVKQFCVIVSKADSQISGSKGNAERFYLLKILKV